MDNETIIAAIKKRPAIWDSSNKFYKNKAVVKAMWDEIALELNCDCEVEVLKARWKNLRDYYRNELKKIQKREETQGEGCKSAASVWPYIESMSFVKHLVNTRGQQVRSGESKISFIKCEQTDDIDDVEFKNEYDYEDDSTNLEESETAENTSYNTPPPSLIAEPAPPPTNTSSRLYSLLESGTKRSSTPVETYNGDMVIVKRKKISQLETAYKETEDSDLLFLKSLLPDIKSLPRVRRIQLRVKFQELVCKAVEEMEATTSTAKPRIWRSSSVSWT